MSDYLAQLTEMFRAYFDDDQIVLTRETTADDIEDWDSLAQVGLILSIEKRFGIKFTSSDVDGLANVGEMVDLIGAKQQ
ncbi:acyl carrier protein [Devosia sp.]|jgi:acyl carrier protein|uniref:acyl carrier protein n=1 Tax=Devosia sp. TaxID=1871048 RepID=UPI003EED9DDE